MKLNYKKIGDYIELVDKRNVGNEYTVKDLKGIRIDKTFIPSVANVSETDLSKYKIVEKNVFAFTPMQVGRDKTIRVVLYKEEKPAIISPAYLTFVVKRPVELLPEYLMMNFLRTESDRYGWFISDGSVRASLEWDRFCDIEIPLPSIEKQSSIVDLYNSVKSNLEYLRSSCRDLQKITESYIDGVKKTVNHVNIGSFIEVIDNRNAENKYTVHDLRGINIKKTFIPSVANVSGTDLSKYKIVEKNVFAFSPMQVGRDKTIRVVLYEDDVPAIISPAYITFVIKNSDRILPEYLMLNFMRPESDRYGWFISDGSVRASLEINRFRDIEIPLPSIDEQRAIVEIHHVLRNRKEIADKLEKQIKDLTPILIRGIVEQMDTGKER
ncbi:restriction endonuclease subunit S [Sporosarcina sp. ANT_H38]|uniref:restriction endonuclease subunit S n=1 Tax=Sporosarcina sp. ANT_H38 TaxID=2597358 RepID=UPI0011F19422|nr:restriction endonuclease subunit S [Sporosarcina sp. ANT_H38]KAA0941650.1 restriction endonuclease subunit S [Sporosarcina sp. ANT_H38]